MNASELRDLSLEELSEKQGSLVEELFNLRFQHEIGQLENPQIIKKTKRNIARIKTIRNETTKDIE